MGVPVVLSDGLVVLAIETLTQARFDDVCTLGPEPVLAITGWRARTLKAREGGHTDMGCIHCRPGG